MQKIAFTKMESIGPGGESAHLSFDGDVNTGWFPGWNAPNYPASSKGFFDGEYTIQKVRVFDLYGQPTIKFQDEDGAEFLSVKLDQFKNWREWNLNVKASAVIITIQDLQGEKVVPEIEFYGVLTGTVTPPVVDDPVIVVPPVLPHATASGAALALGTNGFDWVPIDKLVPIVTNLRLYGYLGWTMTPNGIACSPIRREDVDYDALFKQYQDAGIEVIPCSSYAPDWFFTEKPPKWEHQPLADDLSKASDPNSYKRYASYMYQMAARYGKTKVADSKLKVDTTPRFAGDAWINKKRSGLGLLNWLQIGNEPDSWWNPPYAQHTAQQYAACVSAAVDGHCGTMGEGYGIWNADPHMRIVMGGLSCINQPYLQDMLEWFKENRPDHDWPRNPITGEPVHVDVHHYDNTGNEPVGGKPQIAFKHGCAPETDDLYTRLVNLRTWVDVNIPGAQMWLSEFGWDTVLPSLQEAPDEQTQAEWIVRGYLLALAAGCEKVFVYNAIDENSGSGLYQTCGLMYAEVPKNPNEVPLAPKASYHAVRALYSSLNGRRVTKNLSATPDIIALGLESVDPAVEPALIAWTTDDSRVIRLQTNVLMAEMPKEVGIK